MKKTITILVLFLSFMAVVIVHGNEKFLSGALDEDEAIKDLSTRITEIKDKQKESNVFTKTEIKKSEDTIQRVNKVRDENIGNAIANLKKTVDHKNKDKEELGAYYDNARDEYQKAVKKMNVIYDNQVKELIDKQDTQALYERQKKLLNETKEFQTDLNQKNNKAGEDDLDKVAGMSIEQEEIKKLCEVSSLQLKMDQSSKSLKSLELPVAIKIMQEILDEMKKDLNLTDPDSENSQGVDPDELQKKIDEIESQLKKNLDDDSKKLSDEERQDIAIDLSKLANEIEDGDQGGSQDPPEAGDQGDPKPPEGGDQGDEKPPEAGDQGDKKPPEGGEKGDPKPPEGGEPGDPKPQDGGGPADDIQQAMLNVLKKDDAKALQNLQQAQKGLQQMAKGKPSPIPGEPGEDSQGESKPKEGGELYGQRLDQQEGSDWKASLPPKERAALLAIQKAKYSTDLEMTIRKYFKELAK